MFATGICRVHGKANGVQSHVLPFMQVTYPLEPSHLFTKSPNRETRFFSFVYAHGHHFEIPLSYS